MTSLRNHHSSDLVKLLLLGDAKSGKTTALASLALAGWKLRILDFDNLLDPFAQRVRAKSPDSLDSVEFRSLRDRYKGTDAGMALDGAPKAWTDSLKMLNKWKYNDPTTGEIIDYGEPAMWGHDVILVIDSLSRWCDAAYNYHEAAIPRGKSGDFDGRAVYGNSQDDVEKQLASLTSPTFRTNVIVIAHGVYQSNPDGTTKIFPQGVGQKLSPKIPQYFPNYIRMTNRKGVRRMQLASDLMIDLANTLPEGMANKDLDPATGLAEIFEALIGKPKGQAEGKQEETAPTIEPIPEPTKSTSLPVRSFKR
jgi:hypothetical protein